MKLTDILKFFTATVAILALLCIVFPSGGVSIGGVTFRFPSLHNVLAPEKEKSIDELLVNETKRDISGLKDSIADCKQRIFESQIRLWLPDDDITCFDRFFEKAEQAQKDGSIVRVLHYGDSQIEMDRITCRLRERMQQQFGGGGPGMLPLRQPVPSVTFNQRATGSLVGQSTWGDSSYRRVNGNYGPMLRSWHVNGNATLSLSSSNSVYATPRVSNFSSVRVLCNNRQGNFTVTMKNRKGPGEFSHTLKEEGVQIFGFKMDTVSNSVALTFSGNADVYGILVDDGPGVAVDNIGMRGVSGHQFTKTNADQLTASYQAINVGMIIMQFGGNSVPYLNGEKSIGNYCKRLGEQIDYIHKVCPEAVVLFVGPSDMSTTVNGQLATWPKLPMVVEQLRIMANEHGAAYWSIYDVMGGKNSMITWVKNGLAGPDYIHFTMKGANIMGDYLSDIIFTMYELYCIRRQITTRQFNEIWKEK